MMIMLLTLDKAQEKLFVLIETACANCDAFGVKQTARTNDKKRDTFAIDGDRRLECEV